MSEETSDVQAVDNTRRYAVMRAILYNLLPYTLGPATRSLEDSIEDPRFGNIDRDRAATLTFLLAGAGALAQAGGYYIAYQSGIDPRIFPLLPLVTNIATKGYTQP